MRTGDRSVPGERRIQDLLDAADAFQLRSGEAARIAASVADAVDRWADTVTAFEVPASGIRAMAGAFDAAAREQVHAAASAHADAIVDIAARPHAGQQTTND